MQSSLEVNPDGRLAKTKRNLRELIDRYVPLHTREEVYEMQRLHEERVWDLLFTIHEYRERNQRMAEQMVKMEDEFYSRTVPDLSFGQFQGEAMMDLQHMTRTYRLQWSPDRYRMYYAVSDMLDKERQPHLCEAIRKAFIRRAEKELIPALEREFVKTFLTAHKN